MKAEKFEESLTNIKDEYIEEAVNYQALPQEKKTRTSVKVWRTIAIVAAGLVALAVIVTVVGINSARLGSSSAEKNLANDVPYESYDDGELGGATAPESNSDEYASEYYNGATTNDMEPSVEDGMTEEKQPGGNSESTVLPEGTKIIYTANMHISTKDFAASEQMIETIMKKYNGFFENMDLNNSSSSYKNAYYTIRIPADNLDSFLKDMEEVGTIDSLKRSGTDVSESYYDTETRLETAKKKLARLQELLAQATNISDIIVIEESISEVELEIDELTGTLKNYDSNVKYSTVSIDLNEVYNLDDNSDGPLSFGERISQGFKDGLSTFGAVFEELLIWLASSWLWILIILVVAAAVVIIVVKSEKKTRKSKK